MDPRTWSTEAKVAAGVGVVAAVGVGTYLLYAEKGDGKAVQNAPSSPSKPKDVSVSSGTGAVPLPGVPGTKKERSFIAVKPDGTQRGLVGEIIRRFEAKGFKLVALKLVTPTAEFAAKHYEDLKLKPFFPGLVKFFSSGPVVAMVWEGLNVIKSGRVLLGATNPADSSPGTIRGDFAVHVGRNICHGSDSAEGAEHEINLWWKPEEIISWSSANEGWVYEAK
jgi:nucleoside-diphosphate kinase